MKNSVSIFRFIVIGTLNALITAVVVGVLMNVGRCNYLWSNVAGYTAALINNFFWSKHWIFRSKNDHLFWREVLLFFIAFVTAYSAQFLVLLLLVEVVGVNNYLAQFLGLFIYGSINFVMNKKITFS